MELRQLEHPLLETETMRPLKHLAAIRLYHWYRGRNAYHGKWATHYFPGCVHRSLASAKSSVEAFRAQGSVFYIEQLPSLLLIARDYCAVVTQINCQEPLKDYSYRALSEKDGSRRATAKGQVVLIRGQRLDAIAMSFAYDSDFWKVPQPRFHSVLVLSTDGPPDDFEPLNNEALLQWTSRPQEPRLDWREGKSALRGRAVLNLRSRFEAQSNSSSSGRESA